MQKGHINKCACCCLFYLLYVLPVKSQVLDKRVSITVNEISVLRLLAEIGRQAGLESVYDHRLFDRYRRVSVKGKDMLVDSLLVGVFPTGSVSWKITNDRILFSQPEDTNNLFKHHSYGYIRNAAGKPLVGVTVVVKGVSQRGTTTDINGYFSLNVLSPYSTLNISCIGYESIEVSSGKNVLSVILKSLTGNLNESVITAGNNWLRREDISSINLAKERWMGMQSGTDALLNIGGQVPGFNIQPTSGLSGAMPAISIRGRSSLNSNVIPLVVIDGIPVNSYIENASGGILDRTSVWSYLNQTDIEKIEIAKDPYTTAYYGSRGANGAILITTKKARKNQYACTFEIFRGVGNIARKVKLLNTEQYLLMRRDAFANDRIMPTTMNARDLLLWDSTRYTDWEHELIGGSSNYMGVQATVSDGNERDQYYLNVNFRLNSTPFPGPFKLIRGGTHFSWNRVSKNGRLNNLFVGNLSFTNTFLPGRDFTAMVNLPPNAPLMPRIKGEINYDSQASVLAYAGPQFKGNVQNTTLSMISNYDLAPGTQLTFTAGYNGIMVDNLTISPLKMYPFSERERMRGASSRTEMLLQSLYIEPYISYRKTWRKHKWGGGIGGRLNGISKNTERIDGSGYTSDRDIEDLSKAPVHTLFYESGVNKYMSAYGKAFYEFADKYHLQLMLIGDRSNMLIGDRRISPWGAGKAEWYFSKEHFLKRFTPAVGNGKCWISYGKMGNDQMNINSGAGYQPVEGPYMGVVGTTLTAMPNKNYTSEITRKWEIGTELSRVRRVTFTLTAVYYNNRSSNLLINTSLKEFTGMNNVWTNSERAALKNTGIEIMAQVEGDVNRRLFWYVIVNASRERNKLLLHPDLSGRGRNSPIGRSITDFKVYEWQGISSGTGIPQFSNERTIWINTQPGYYGGLQTRITYWQLQLDASFKFVFQTGLNDQLANAGILGKEGNQPEWALKRWRKQGDVTDVPKASQSAAMESALLKTRQSNAVYTNASYGRITEASLTWYPVFSRKKGKRETSIYMLTRNPLIFTGYKGREPELQKGGTLPLLREFVVGVKLHFK